MATRKTASKSSSRASLDLDIDSKQSKKTNKKINKTIKKASAGAIILAVVLLVVGAVGGYFGVKFLTRNDCFEIVGKDELTLTLGENYADQSVKAISFGKDVSEKVEIETNLKQNEDGSYYADEVGTYYIVYKVNDIKYNSIFKVQKIRLLTFVEATEQEEIESANGGTT